MNRRADLFTAPLLGLALLALSGCRTAQIQVDTLRPLNKVFQPAAPAQVRLPIHIVLPKGADYVTRTGKAIKEAITKIQSPKLLLPDFTKIKDLQHDAHVVNLWKAMQEPIFLDDQFWLLVKPSTLSIGLRKPDLKKPFVTQVTLQMTAQPEVVFGPKPATTPVALPRLGKFQPGPGIFHAMSNARFSFKEANAYFRDPQRGLLGKVVADKGKGNLTLKGIRFYGEDGRVCIEAKLLYDPPITFSDKPSQVTVVLRGTPRYLAKRQTFDFPDLDLDIHSGNLLVKLAGLLLKGKIRDELRREAKIPVGAKLDWLRGRVDLALNRPLGRFARLRTSTTSLQVHDALADAEGIVIRCSIQGSSTLDLVWND